MLTLCSDSGVVCAGTSIFSPGKIDSIGMSAGRVITMRTRENKTIRHDVVVDWRSAWRYSFSLGCALDEAAAAGLVWDPMDMILTTVYRFLTRI